MPPVLPSYTRLGGQPTRAAWRFREHRFQHGAGPDPPRHAASSNWVDRKDQP